MSASSLGSKVAQNTNDIAAIYDIVARLERGQRRQATKLSDFVKETRERFDRVDKRFEGLESQLATVIDIVTRLEQRSDRS